jgi:hypothetical protein
VLSPLHEKPRGLCISTPFDARLNCLDASHRVRRGMSLDISVERMSLSTVADRRVRPCPRFLALHLPVSLDHSPLYRPRCLQAAHKPQTNYTRGPPPCTSSLARRRRKERVGWVACIRDDMPLRHAAERACGARASAAFGTQLMVYPWINWVLAQEEAFGRW